MNLFDFAAFYLCLVIICFAGAYYHAWLEQRKHK